jgi:signal transduction histidine kinase
VDTTIVPYKDSHGKIVKYISIRKDITAEVLSQSVLKAKTDELVKGAHDLETSRAAAERAAQAKADFLSTMSHEIRTPLNSVIGMSDLLLDTQLTPDQVEISRAISSSGKTLLHLVNDILDFSKIEAGKLDFESIEFDLSSYLADSLKPYVYTAEKKGLKFDVNIPELPRTVWGDEGA